MKLDDFNSITDEAFAFLQARFGYRAEPAARGGFHGSAFVRRFMRGDLRMTLVLGDADSRHFCQLFFSDGIDEKVHKHFYMERSLAVLLMKRHPQFEHPDSRDLPTHDDRKAVIFRYAELVKEFALDVVDGDFSVFPTLVFALFHVDREFPSGEIRRFIGVYSSHDRVSAAIEERRPKPGYVDRQDGFEIWRVEMDGLSLWYAGIPLDEPRVI